MENNDDIQEIFNKLKENYKSGLVEKKAELEEIISNFNNSEIDIDAIHGIIHKLAGGSGVYGFRELSETASDIEDDIINGIDDKKVLTKKISALIDKINEL